MKRWTAWMSIGWMVIVMGWVVGAPRSERPVATEVQFNRDIRPIFSDTCFKCHGPDSAARKADLRLDTEEGAFAERDGFVPIKPGDPAASEAYRRIISNDPDEMMPPPDSLLSLTGHQKELVRRWIEQGAKFEKHWSLMPVQRPALPPTPGRARSAGGSRKEPAAVRNAIDLFILNRLRMEGLSYSPEADRATLVRRVTLDLTGLPPTLQELDAALSDPSPDWYEKLVDRLLNSPRYGEAMAVGWLDASRYADTHGYHIDSHRDMWRWREWVIDAFNRNKPFDRFTLEQLAGDLLPEPTLEQKIATGFNRNHMINYEGGAIPEEYHAAYIVDRVNTTGAVWLGLTIGCAQCHDHKYDPITQKEYYGLYAFFHNVPENPLDGQKGNAVPFIKAPSSAQRERLERQQAIVADLEKRLAGRAAEAQGDYTAWEAQALAAVAAEPPLPAGAIAHYKLDEKSGTNVADDLGKQPAGSVKGAAAWAEGKDGGGLKLDGNTFVELGSVLDVDRSDRFSMGAWIFPTSSEHGAIVARMDDAVKRGYDLYFGGQVFVHLVSAWEGNAIRVNTKQSLELNKWHHVFATYDGSSQASGVRIYINGQPADVDATHNTLSDTIKVDKPTLLGARNPGAKFKGSLDDVWFFGRELSAAEVARLAGNDVVRQTLVIAPDQRTAEQKDVLRKHYLENHDPAYVQINAELATARKALAEIDAAIPTTMVMQEMEKPRETYLLMRGEYDKKGEKVAPATPAALGPLPEGAPLNRLGLAQWLVNRDHPLTSRVIINRYWQKHFGLGLVKTAEDFGSQGEWPSHPELLDWLADEFMRTGWNVKSIQRLIVTSGAYRQSSAVTPELHERDPENRLMARGPRFRLSAEEVRDNALALSGLLVGRIGGESVRPYHPPGLWEEMAFGGPFTAQKYEQDHGEKLYRRTMYTFWKRTVPPASLATFDAPDREICTVRRLRTNTPLQALVLMNDPTYVEASRKFAERIMREGGATIESRIQFAFRTATARQSTPAEASVLRRVYEQRLAAFREDPSSVEQLLTVGESPRDPSLDPAELAAWASIASVILGLDETITKG